MTRHHRTLLRLNRMVSEAEHLCAEALAAGAERGVRAAPDTVLSAAFQTVLDRRVRKWIARAEATLNTVRPTENSVCGRRSEDLRHLVDIANAAILTRADRRGTWNAFYVAARQACGSTSPSDA